MLSLVLVLAATPQLTVTTKDIRLDGKVVLSLVPDDGALPALKAALEANQQPTVRLEFAPSVTFKLARRVLMTMGAAGKRRPDGFFVGTRGPFPLNQDDSEATVVAVNPRGEPAAAVAIHIVSKAPKTKVVAFSVADAVTMERLSQWLVTFRDEGYTRHELDAADMEPAPEETAPPLTQREVAQIFKLNGDDLNACYQNALQRAPKLAGEVHLKFVVTPSGKVSELSTVKDTTGSPTLARCLGAAVRNFTFPQSAKGLSVTYPLVFKAP